MILLLFKVVVIALCILSYKLIATARVHHAVTHNDMSYIIFFTAHLKLDKTCTTKLENAIYEEIQSQRPPPKQVEMQACPAYQHVNTPYDLSI